MTIEALLPRITANPKVLGGKPIIRGMRISVEMILALLAQGASHQELLDDYPPLEEEDNLARSALGGPRGAGHTCSRLPAHLEPLTRPRLHTTS